MSLVSPPSLLSFVKSLHPNTDAVLHVFANSSFRLSPKTVLAELTGFSTLQTTSVIPQPVDLYALVDASWEDAFHSQGQSPVKFTNAAPHDDRVSNFLKELVEMKHLSE